MLVDHSANSRIKRNSPKVFEPGHTYTFEAAVERAREALSRFIDGKRRAGIGARDRTEHQSQIGYRTPKASRRTQRGPCKRGFRVRYAANRRAEANHVAKRSRIAQRAAGIGAGGNGY